MNPRAFCERAAAVVAERAQRRRRAAWLAMLLAVQPLVVDRC